MAKILSFRGKEETTSSGQPYLTDDAEKLSFHTAEDGCVSLDDVATETLPITGVYADPQKDWTNQELADLFRVRQLLSGAHVSVETMRGITDEGDPWFIYCHLNGDVFIHMARIDGTYVLDSPNVHRPLRGADFNGLIADFTSGALPAFDKAGDGNDTERRVVRLELGGKVRLHPSAMLAALIWTLFLASEELVMLLPEERETSSDDLLDFTDIIAADAEFAALETTGIEENHQQAETAFKIDHEEIIHTPAPDGHGQIRDAMGQQGLAMQQNAYAMGLSTIAIAMGFMSEAVLLDNQRKVLEGLKTVGVAHLTEGGANNPELDQIAGTSSDALMEKLAEFLGLDLSLNTDVAEAPTPGNEGSLLQQDMMGVTTTAVEVGALPQTSTIEDLAIGSDDIELADSTAGLSSDADTMLLTTATTTTEELDSISMSDLLNEQIQMEEFELGGTTVMASFDLSSNDTLSLSDYLFTSQRSTDHQSFDERAQSFIDFIQAKETEVGIVTFGNEIIMIDRDAFRYDGAENYSLTWETYDGQVISMIGLRSEFQEFDLIA